MIQFATPTPDPGYAAIQAEIDRQYPAGRFVAVERGQVVADAQTHVQLVDRLRSLGKSPQNLLIVQAGIEYPRSATIFTG